MEVPLLLQFSIALFTGMVAATLVPPVRRSIPRPVEILMWIGLVAACLIGVLNIKNLHARELTVSAFWGVDQVINTSAGLLAAGVLGTLSAQRWNIAPSLVIISGADVLALALLHSHRQSRGWQPRVHLGEWLELPRLELAPAPAKVPYALDDVNRRLAAAAAIGGAALLMWLVDLSIWVRDIALPRHTSRLAHGAAAGLGGSQARLDGLRDTASQLQFAARAWYVAAGAPAVNDLATKAIEVVRSAPYLSIGEPGELAPHGLDIHVLMSAPSLGWYGPQRPVLTEPDEVEDEDGAGHPGRLAS